uniref:Kinesin-like protein n=1 Tax=Trypanosoma congolense (strain IL3000) TaxID=1068625 RepID=G0UQW0_TRYCI|nr:putative kinesin [Trypanosoma congolense IL3000]
MGKSEGIRVFLRVRPPAKGLPKPLNSVGSCRGDSDVQTFSIEHTFENSIVRLHVDRRADMDVVNNSKEDFTFTFRRAFEPSATQADVFNTVAKDCVLAALDGYNSTVFAYGQTGSGKTHSITGGAESYEDRGIIPRALALLYDEVARRQQQEGTYSVSISYLQIYNDKGQDLLNRGRDARKLEELPVVTIHDGGSDSDEVTLRGLAQHSAATPKDALNLLFLGDTNRLYCETPMNKTSSRSHCVFTVYLEARPHGTPVVRRSKLHFVDLAGSERVAKTGVSGTVLTEAKHINLSLHYLEQVIMALSEQASGRREHIPFRNSFMTMVLRDSLGPNCRTSMLATAHPAVDQLPETISTCRFAQRVALIKQDARINEEVDPHILVRKLKAELQQVRDQLAFYTKDGASAPDRDLSDDEKLRCEEMVKRFVDNADSNGRIEGFDGDLARIYYCFDVLKCMMLGRGGGGSGEKGALGSEAQQQLEVYRSRVDALELSLKQKENEMNMLFDALQKVHRPRYNAETQTRACDALGDGLVDGAGAPASAAGGHLVLKQPLPTGRLSDGVHLQGGVGSVNSSGSSVLMLAPALRRAACERLDPAEATAVDEFFERQQQLNEAYDLSSLTDAELLQDRAAAFEAFKRSYRQCAQIEANKQELKGRYEACKVTAKQLNDVVDQIRKLKGCVQQLRAERVLQGVEEVDVEERSALEELATKKTQYNELAASLKTQKESIDTMHLFMKRAQEQLTKDFEDWLQIRQKQLLMAVKGSVSSSSGSGGVSKSFSTVDSGNNISINNNVTSTAILTGNANATPLLAKPLGPVTPISSEVSPTPIKPRITLLQQQQQQLHAGEQRHISTSMPDLPPLRKELSSRRMWDSEGALTTRSNGLHSAPPDAQRAAAVSPLVRASSLQAQPNTHGSTRTGTLYNGWTGGNGDVSAGGSVATEVNAPNPYAPGYRSTGDPAADKQLAELYKARDALRQQFES